ncbi:MmcQ/YjbR family DNA-binding protein [Salinispora tropica]|uniref:MmcQ/YjbR family DNA-binding protein n=1 Tax=Salinispora tropica TaxID=168695 RepID=UPI0003797801|nr:MmcQ/YjbR family DNA-binding protein [Salinispora tropica]
MISEDDVRQRALTLPEAHASAHFDNADLRVRNKIFASFPAGAGTVMLRLSPQDQAELLAEDPATFSAPDNHWGRQGWTSARLDRVDPVQLGELLTEAWRLRAPRRLVTAFDARHGDTPD